MTYTVIPHNELLLLTLMSMKVERKKLKFRGKKSPPHVHLPQFAENVYIFTSVHYLTQGGKCVKPPDPSSSLTFTSSSKLHESE